MDAGYHAGEKMTQRINYEVACNCGHTGKLVMRENDAPYSTQWEQYELTGFNGHSSCGRDPGWMILEEVFKVLAPTCPKCNQPINESNIKKGLFT